MGREGKGKVREVAGKHRPRQTYSESEAGAESEAEAEAEAEAGAEAEAEAGAEAGAEAEAESEAGAEAEAEAGALLHYFTVVLAALSAWPEAFPSSSAHLGNSQPNPRSSLAPLARSRVLR